MGQSLGDRIKSYEDIERRFLVPRTPIIIRIDGRAFHSYTRGFESPFDDGLRLGFIKVQDYLMESVQGCRVAYTQSDEISLFCHSYERFDSEQLFGGNIQKICSVVSSMTTLKFNECVRHPKEIKAMFDCRVFTLPKEEVANYFLWRHKDAMRNAIQSAARKINGHKACMNKKTGELLNMIPQDYWESVAPMHKFGQFNMPDFNGATGAFLDVKTVINGAVNYQTEE